MWTCHPLLFRLIVVRGVGEAQHDYISVERNISLGGGGWGETVPTQGKSMGDRQYDRNLDEAWPWEGIEVTDTSTWYRQRLALTTGRVKISLIEGYAMREGF